MCWYKGSRLLITSDVGDLLQWEDVPEVHGPPSLDIIQEKIADGVVEPGCRAMLSWHELHGLVGCDRQSDRCIVHLPVRVSAPDVHRDDVLQLVIALRIALSPEGLLQPVRQTESNTNEDLKAVLHIKTRLLTR